MPPPAEQGHDGIARPALVARAREALDAGPLLFFAGAGFGKTSLLADVAASEDAVVWVACTDAEREPGALLTAMIAGLRSAAPELAAAFEERLATAPPGEVDPRAATAELLAELRELQPEPALLVLDDAERLDGAPALPLVEEVVRSAPSSLRVALASRRRLELRLAKLRLEGALAELGPEDLAFGPEECAALLRLARGTEPTHEEVEAVMTATEGWPLGISLLARTGAEDGAPADLRTGPQLAAYLQEEVLAHLDPGLRRGVIDSAVARRLRPEVIEALDLGEGFLDDAERAGLITRAPGSGEARYHPLLHESLERRLADERSGEEIRALNSAAAAAVAEIDAAEAIDHWLEAGSWREAVDAMAAQPMLVVSSPERVGGWLRRLPDEYADDPAILVLRAHMSRTTGDHETTVGLLGRAVEAFGDGGGLAGWMARFELTMAMFLTADFERTFPYTAGFDSPEAAEAGPVAPAVAESVAIALAALGRFDESEDLAARAAAHPAAALLAPLEALRRCHVDVPRGRLEELRPVLEGAFAATEGMDPMTMRPYLLAGWAMVEDDMGETDRALELWSQSAELAAGGLAALTTNAARSWRAVIFAETGRTAAAEHELALAERPEVGWRGYIYDAARAAVAAKLGDADEAAAAAEAALATMEPGAVQHRLQAGEQMTRALVDAGRHARAEEVVEGNIALVDAVLPGDDGILYRSRAYAMRAWLRHERGDPAAAEDVTRSAEVGGPAWRFILRKDWVRLAPVVSQALEDGAVDAETAVAAIAEAVPAGEALAPLTAHSSPAVRAAALAPAIATGDPAVLRRLGDLAEDGDERVAAIARRALDGGLSGAPPLRIKLLGGFSIERGTWVASDADWGRAAAAKLVRFLAIQGRVPVPEEVIFEALWPQLEPAGASRSLRVAASLARKVLELPGAERGGIEVSGGSYSLVLDDRDTIDAERFERAAEAGLAAAPGDRTRLLQEARSRWSGEPLPKDRFEDWAAAWRSRLVDLYVAVLGQLATGLGEAGEHHAQLGVARELVEIDPHDEAAHRLVMTAYARTGRRGQALRQYLACRRELVDELGIEPSRETAALHGRILAGEAV